MADTASFQITYRGTALDNNEMDIRELAPALVAVADLLEEANAIINGGGVKINVNVHGSFKSGSFGIDFTVVEDIFQEIMQLFNSPAVTSAVNLLTIVGFTIGGTQGLISLLKLLRNRKIRKIEEIENNRVQITIIPEETIIVDSRVITLYKSQRIRNAVEQVIYRPLSKDGVDEFRSSDPKSKRSVVVQKMEKEYYEVPLLEDELLGENVTEAYLQVISLAFKEDNKWRFARGDQVFFASVKDEAFLARIERNEETFSKDDILKVKLQTKDILTGTGMHTEYTVLEVLLHRSAARQLHLPMENENDDENKSPA
jgi:hypothetical protein